MFKRIDLRSENDYRVLEDEALNRAFDCATHLSRCLKCGGFYKLVRGRKNDKKSYGSIYAVCATYDCKAQVMTFYGKHEMLQKLGISPMWIKILTFGPFPNDLVRTPNDIPKIPTTEYVDYDEQQRSDSVEPIL